MRRALDWGSLALAAGIVLLGLFYAVDTLRIPTSPGYARVGPTVFPAIVAAGLVVIGIVLVRMALVPGGLRATPGEAGPVADWRWPGFLWVSGGLIVHLAIVKPAGFIPAATVLFVFVTRALGSRRPARDVLVGLLLAGIVFVGFNYGLGLSLPRGPLERFL